MRKVGNVSLHVFPTQTQGTITPRMSVYHQKPKGKTAERQICQKENLPNSAKSAKRQDEPKGKPIDLNYVNETHIQI